jgi:PAS domain S-box-containing protein
MPEDGGTAPARRLTLEWRTRLPGRAFFDQTMNDFPGKSLATSVERHLRERDWSTSPLGAPASWPPALAYAARFVLDAATPMFLGWGGAAAVLYNDAAVALLGGHHPGLLGASLRDWPEAWVELHGHVARALGGEAFRVGQLARALGGGDGAPAWAELAFAPLRDLDGVVHGFTCTVSGAGALRDGDAGFRALTDAMPQMVWSTLPDGYHDYYNQRWYDFTGMHVGETDGVRWNAMFHEDDRERAWSAWRASLDTGAPYEIEYRLRHHSGEYRWVLGRALPVRDGGGRIVRWMGTCTDIHQQKRSEEALQDARMRLSAALVAADIGTWTFDLANDRVYADRNLAGIFGVDEATAAGGPLSAYLARLHPDDVDHTRRCIDQAVDTGDGFECTYRVQRADGTWRHVLARGKVTCDAAGRPAWLPGVVLDISRQKGAEEALRASEMRFRRLAESNVVGIVRYRMDGTIIDANQAFLDMLGYSRADFERGGLHSGALTPPEWAEATARAMAQLRTMGRVGNVVKEYFRKDGSRVSVQMGSTTLDDPPTEGVAVMVDITPIKEAQHALREADLRKDEFLAMLAHELRNPLAPITAAADFLKIGQPDEERVRQVTAIIGRQARHMTGLIDDLLDVSRVTRGLITLERAPVALAGVIGEAVEQVRPQMKAKGHQLELHLPSDEALVSGDRKRLVQVFANILGNAARYTPDLAPGGGRIDLHARLADDSVSVDVCDNGIGMTPDLTARAFELFSQAERSADRAQGGLGIGLALVKSLVELHDGTVAAHSDGPGRGSRFTVVLPRLRVEGDDADDEPAAVGAVAPAEALEVLIVDDNVDAAQILAMYIEAVGHRATVWHSPGKALAYAASHPPDLCVLDIGLPEFDGHELARRLRALPGMAALPMVAVSGYGQAHDRDRALAAGFDRHFVKPVMAADILEVLDDVAVRRAGERGPGSV